MPILPLPSPGLTAHNGDDVASRAAIGKNLEQAGFHWVTIPEGITISSEETFDPVAMQALYDVGYRSAVAGAQWATRPPGLWVETLP